MASSEFTNNFIATPIVPHNDSSRYPGTAWSVFEYDDSVGSAAFTQFDWDVAADLYSPHHTPLTAYNEERRFDTEPATHQHWYDLDEPDASRSLSGSTHGWYDATTEYGHQPTAFGGGTEDGTGSPPHPVLSEDLSLTDVHASYQPSDSGRGGVSVPRWEEVPERPLQLTSRERLARLRRPVFTAHASWTAYNSRRQRQSPGYQAVRRHVTDTRSKYRRLDGSKPTATEVYAFCRFQSMHPQADDVATQFGLITRYRFISCALRRCEQLFEGRAGV